MVAEYLINAMAHRPGLSRETILAQLQREYGENMTEKMAAFEVKRVENGERSGVTVLERMGGSIRSVTQGRFPGPEMRRSY
jgi:hypothetical protein